jgi:aryl-alcohol dehydrogenase-like predicted oxidoreductase
MDQHNGSSSAEFSHTVLPAVGKRVFRMGVAGNYGIGSPDIEWAADHGVNYWVCGLGYGKVSDGIRNVLARDRDAHVLALLSGGYFGWMVRKSVESTLRKLNTGYIDIFKLGWLGKTSSFSRGVVDTLLELKREGKIRAIGTSIHDRKRAGRLAVDSVLDAFMIRYSAKHPGAEQDIFPHLAKRNPAVISYTALAWGQLLRPLKGLSMPPWPGSEPLDVPPLTPGLCYRYVLSSPHVHVVLTGPKTREQLAGNLESVGQGPLSEAEMEWLREYGRKVKNYKTWFMSGDRNI